MQISKTQKILDYLKKEKKPLAPKEISKELGIDRKTVGVICYNKSQPDRNGRIYLENVKSPNGYPMGKYKWKPSDINFEEIYETKEDDDERRLNGKKKGNIKFVIKTVLQENIEIWKAFQKNTGLKEHTFFHLLTNCLAIYNDDKINQIAKTFVTALKNMAENMHWHVDDFDLIPMPQKTDDLIPRYGIVFPRPLFREINNEIPLFLDISFFPKSDMKMFREFLPEWDGLIEPFKKYKEIEKKYLEKYSKKGGDKIGEK